MNSKNLSVFLVFLLFSFVTHAASFNCTKAERPIDKAICADPDLSALDEKLATVYTKLFAINPSVKEEQREWLRSLKQCNNDINTIASCLKPMFVDRIQILDNQLQSLSEGSVSSSMAVPSQQNLNAVEQVKPTPLSNSNQSKKIELEEKNSSFSSAIAAIFIGLTLLVIFMVFKRRKKVYENNDKQEASDSQKTRTSQTIAPIAPVAEVIPKGYIEENSAGDDDLEEVPAWDGVEKDSPGYQISVLISIINNDTWFPNGSTGSFILDKDVKITSEEESIDDPGIFLENYDEMTLYRLKDYEGTLFSDTEAISAILTDEDNMWQFTYTFDFSEAVEPCAPLFPYSVVSSREVRVRYIQFGAGTECGYRVDLASDLDLSWLSAWIQGIRDRGETVSEA